MGTEFIACYRFYTQNTAKISPYLSKEAKNITVSHDGRHRVNESIKITFFTQVPHKLMINTSIKYQTRYMFVQLFVEILVYSYCICLVTLYTCYIFSHIVFMKYNKR